MLSSTAAEGTNSSLHCYSQPLICLCLLQRSPPKAAAMANCLLLSEMRTLDWGRNGRFYSLWGISTCPARNSPSVVQPWTSISSWKRQVNDSILSLSLSLFLFFCHFTASKSTHRLKSLRLMCRHHFVRLSFVLVRQGHPHAIRTWAWLHGIADKSLLSLSSRLRPWAQEALSFRRASSSLVSI